ncbi:MAG TPA: helix-turn-helix transcriptional regulator [Symbiobacteriaceae bacterium]|nr:helix-turn-helix transcriptional regulator [Symbiobacteriaceae bacterium]
MTFLLLGLPQLAFGFIPIISVNNPTNYALMSGGKSVGLGKRKNNLAFWRRVRGLSQDEVGHIMGVSGRAVCHWELDETLPSKDQARQLARLLRVNIRELFPYEIF